MNLNVLAGIQAKDPPPKLGRQDDSIATGELSEGSDTSKSRFSSGVKFVVLGIVALSFVAVILLTIQSGRDQSEAAVSVNSDRDGLDDSIDSEPVFLDPSNCDNSETAEEEVHDERKKKPEPTTTETPSTIPSFLASLSPSEPLTTDPPPEPTSLPSSPPTDVPTNLPTKKPTKAPTKNPTVMVDGVPVTYTPGKLTTLQAGLLLSEGLGARLISSSGQKVEYADGTFSEEKFHGAPDGAEAYPDPRAGNEGGWIYVSNSEMPDNGTGGVGAITFDKNGNIFDYKMILEGTTMNCGGGATPWNTWVSCEEVEFTGLIYQVDPTGERQAQVMKLGSGGGRWESFAYDIRDRSRPRFFVTEDHNKGAVRRFTPQDPNWDQPWSMLHDDGMVHFLMLSPTEDGGGTFEWTTNKEAALNNARSYYPQTEGIDVYNDQLFFVCKRIKQIYTINLDSGTYSNRTTVNGLFDGKPDQMQRLLDDPRDILYFTEEGGKDAGVHARDASGRYYTILESPEYTDETSGLAFSPDSKHLIIAYQEAGLLFDVYRLDGLPFNAKRLDVKYHAVGLGT